MGLFLRGNFPLVRKPLEGLSLVDGGHNFRESLVGVLGKLLQKKQLPSFPLPLHLHQITVPDQLNLKLLLSPREAIHQGPMLLEEKLRQLDAEALVLHQLLQSLQNNFFRVQVELGLFAVNDYYLFISVGKLRVLGLGLVCKQNSAGARFLHHKPVHQFLPILLNFGTLVMFAQIPRNHLFPRFLHFLL